MAKHNRFTSTFGKATFKCDICERTTRDTGQDVDGVCQQDYELAGIDNAINDGGYKPGDDGFDCHRDEVNMHLAKIAKLGGNVRRTVNSNYYLFQEGHCFTIPSNGKSTEENLAVEKAAQKEASGTITIRKARGKKHRFLMGGPTLKDAVTCVNWDGIKANELVFWTSHDGGKPIQVLNTLEGKRKIVVKKPTFTELKARYNSAAMRHFNIVHMGKLDQASQLVEHLKVLIAEIEAVNR